MTSTNQKININISFRKDVNKDAEPKSKPLKECITCFTTLNKANKKRCVTCDQAIICRDCSKKLDRCPMCRAENFGIINPKNNTSFKEINSDIIDLIYNCFNEKLLSKMFKVENDEDEQPSDSSDEIAIARTFNNFFGKKIDLSSPDKSKLKKDLIEFLNQQTLDRIGEFSDYINQEIFLVHLFDDLINDLAYDNVDETLIHEMFGNQITYLMFVYCSKRDHKILEDDGYSYTIHNLLFFYIRTLITELLEDFATHLSNNPDGFIKLITDMLCNPRISFEILAVNFLAVAFSKKDSYDYIPREFDD